MGGLPPELLMDRVLSPVLVHLFLSLETDGQTQTHKDTHTHTYKPMLSLSLSPLHDDGMKGNRNGEGCQGGSIVKLLPPAQVVIPGS